MSGPGAISDQIVSYTRELKLPGIRQYFQTALQEAMSSSLGYDEYLRDVLRHESELRVERRRQNLLRQAGFSNKRYLQDLEVDCLPEDARSKLNLLRSLEFVENGRNVILAGNPGTGKTHLAVGLGIEACMRNYKVLFTSVPTLITQLKECRSERTLRSFQGRFKTWDLVICDEFGYISFDKEGAELLFTLLSLRSGHKSTLITTNLSFDRWQELFGDPVLTAAMVDRLTHKAHLVNMNGNSYRLKETQEWLKAAKK